MPSTQLFSVKRETINPTGLTFVFLGTILLVTALLINHARVYNDTYLLNTTLLFQVISGTIFILGGLIYVIYVHNRFKKTRDTIAAFQVQQNLNPAASAFRS